VLGLTLLFLFLLSDLLKLLEFGMVHTLCMFHHLFQGGGRKPTDLKGLTGGDGSRRMGGKRVRRGTILLLLVRGVKLVMREGG
jgi:hypothetical protein